MVVVGAGGAGLCAAIEACTAEASVLVLESQPVCGGSSAICGGAFSAAWTSMQKEEGITDSPDIFFKELMEIGKQKSVPEIVRAYVDASNDCFEFLKALGVKFTGISIYPGCSVPRIHSTDPAEVIRLLKEEAIRKGAEIWLEAPGKKLMTSETRRVIGVEAEREGKTTYCKAKKAVVVSTGGFGRNPEMLEEFSIHPLSLCIPITAPGTTGDGHRMAFAIGAATESITLGVAPSCPIDVETKQICMPMYQGAVIVNKGGERFVNESIAYSDVGLAGLKQPDGLIFQIFDAPIYDLRV